ncbi:MAG: LysM peptidoglycan-binding domain-containing protein [Eubacteriales bacterium]
MIIHIVEEGDTIFSIASKYGVTPVSIVQNNDLSPSTQLAVGQTLVILFADSIYIVKEGDTLSSITTANGITVKQLLRNNPELSQSPAVYPGQSLVIDYTQEKLREITTNGFAYPFVNLSVLRRTLPFLTYMTLFTYSFNPDGTLIIPDDTEILNITREYGVAPVMCISTLTDEGTFSSELANTLLTSPDLQDILIDNIIMIMDEKGYTSLNIDFEYIYASNAQLYVSFVVKCTERLNAEGYNVFVDLAPKTSINQPGLLYEGHDYASLGAAADGVILMTYEWGFTYGPPMAVAPINKVRDVVEFAVTQISPEKILMGIPNYGYDWPLPFVSGTSKAISLSNAKAVELAADVGGVIEYDETSQAPFFNYIENGISHVVWFEDARSIQAKLELIEEYNLRGGSWWTIMNYFPQNWMVTNALYDIEF